MEPKTKFINGKHVAMKPWDVETRMSAASLGRFTKALIKIQGHWTDAYSTGDDNYSTATFRTWIPEGSEDDFQKTTKMMLKPIPQI